MERLRIIVILCATLMTAVAVSLSGIIGLVGLIVPHLVRFIVGPDFRFLLPGSALMGALFLLASDNLARTLWTMEIPLGILTSLFGVPFFLCHARTDPLSAWPERCWKDDALQDDSWAAAPTCR